MPPVTQLPGTISDSNPDHLRQRHVGFCASLEIQEVERHQFKHPDISSSDNTTLRGYIEYHKSVMEAETRYGGCRFSSSAPIDPRVCRVTGVPGLSSVPESGRTRGVPEAYQRRTRLPIYAQHNHSQCSRILSGAKSCKRVINGANQSQPSRELVVGNPMPMHARPGSCFFLRFHHRAAKV